jgi:pimeloyl-ACP methyl ester carboxylesterase
MRDVLATIRELTERYDPATFEVGRRRARLRLLSDGQPICDVLLEGERAVLEEVQGDRRADAILEADPQTWRRIARDVRGGMEAFRAGRLRVRRDLHLGIGFLAATAPVTEGGLRVRSVDTRMGRISMTEAGQGPACLLIHGLGATKVSMLPTLAALAPAGYRALAVDLPGFGDSVKPLLARYDAAFFARAMVALLDALELERAHVAGNSMGGRVALELGLTAPERVGRLGLLAPSLSWLRARPWAPLLRLVLPQLGVIQPAPRAVVEGIVRRVVPGAAQEWTAAGIDEFLRSYLEPRGRAAFYAAARNIYLEEPRGPHGLWTRLPGLQAPALFVWGRRDTLVPIRFEPRVREALPASHHLELNCGHVPQLERPRETHRALLDFFAQGEGATAASAPAIVKQATGRGR